MESEKIKVISVGGSIIIPKTGFEVEFLKKFRQLILAEVKKGYKFVLVIGGGGTCRAYQAVAKAVAGLSEMDLDWLGIYATRFNAEFVRLLFGDLAYEEVIKNPTKKIKTSRPIILAGGWQPGCSTDRDAVLLAKNFGAKEIINLSLVSFVIFSRFLDSLSFVVIKSYTPIAPITTVIITTSINETCLEIDFFIELNIALPKLFFIWTERLNCFFNFIFCF